MSDFTVRIEMHGASREDYNTLHDLMEKAGYKRFMRCFDVHGKPGTWLLPTAEYTCTSSLDAPGVRDHARRIADTIRTGSWCMVTEVASFAIYGQVV